MVYFATAKDMNINYSERKRHAWVLCEPQSFITHTYNNTCNNGLGTEVDFCFVCYMYTSANLIKGWFTDSLILLGQQNAEFCKST